MVHPFEHYFLKNWDKSKERWVKCFRENCPHLGNNTNNRLESGWGKLKPELHSKMTFDVAISNVLALQFLKEDNFHKKIECNESEQR
ncbi:hypothetical protein PHMEG_00020977 [Phytophthora megakarya]|uniref:Uncharacterized protein n=1 Tax=Phytophthora megakarya TaxID=4795 RepID=A0A225VMF5_9STRA|nr:hypothetical protein PHMEG_00020977 [Phytophthora megakarya]